MWKAPPFSFINLQDDWFINEPLSNTGKGRNLGIDLTLERFLHNGWYYLVTASIFDSRYRGGDGIWRDTRYNRQFIGNVLVGKEWKVGRQNLINLSGRFTYQGGERLHPVDHQASLEKMDIVEDLSMAYGAQAPDSRLLHMTFTYRKNRKKHSSLWSLQMLNLLGDKTFYGYRL